MWCRFKLHRLKTRSQFQFALAGGTVARTAHFALHRAALDPCAATGADALPGATVPSLPLFQVHGTWLGAMVPKRWARRAVTRNAIKRQIYAMSADTELVAAVYVVRLRAGFERKQFISATSEILKATVRQELQQLFAKVRVFTPIVAHLQKGEL